MAEIHRSPQNQGQGRNFSKRLRSMFMKSRPEEPMGANHKVEEDIVAFQLCDKGSFNKNNNSGYASPSPTSWLPISSRDFNAWPSGSKTPPLNSFCSVPFKWEEAPGKAKHSPVDDQLINSDEVQGRFCRWDYDYDEGFDLSVFKVADGAVGFDVEERLVAIYAATPSYHKSGNDHITSQVGFNALAGYDLKSGKRVLFVELDQNAVANDVAVDPYGNAFVTNSAGNFIWKITLDGHVSVFAKDPIFTSQDIIVEDDLVRFCGLNGIVYNKRGALLVSQSNSGKLFEVDLHDGSVRLVQTSKTLPWADGITVRRDGVALVVSHHTAWFLKTRDNWGEATIVDEVPLNASRFATAITLREDDRAYVLNCYLRDSVNKISRDVFSIEEIEFPKEAAGENVWLILLLVAGLLYVFFWRFQMQHFAKNLSKKRV